MNFLRILSIGLLALSAACSQATADGDADGDADEGALTGRPSDDAVEILTKTIQDRVLVLDGDDLVYTEPDPANRRARIYVRNLKAAAEPKLLWEGSAVKALAVDDEAVYFAPVGGERMVLSVSRKGGEAKAIASLAPLDTVVGIAAERKGDAVILDIDNRTVLERVSKRGSVESKTELTEINRVSPSKLTWTSDGTYVYALYPRTKLLAIPMANPTRRAAVPMFDVPDPGNDWATPGLTIDSFSVTEAASSFVAFGTETIRDQVTHRESVILEGKEGQLTKRAAGNLVATESPRVDASTHCAIGAAGANHKGLVKCVRPGADAFVAVPSYGRNIAGVVTGPGRIVWQEESGPVYMRSL